MVDNEFEFAFRFHLDVAFEAAVVGVIFHGHFFLINSITSHFGAVNSPTTKAVSLVGRSASQYRVTV